MCIHLIVNSTVSHCLDEQYIVTFYYIVLRCILVVSHTEWFKPLLTANANHTPVVNGYIQYLGNITTILDPLCLD